MRAIRALLSKDFRILRRSPLMVALLVIYPLALAVLVGAVIADAGARPRVAFVDNDHLPESATIGNLHIEIGDLLRSVKGEVSLVPMSDAKARSALSRGDVVAVVVVPQGFLAELKGLLSSPTLTLETSRGAARDRVLREVQSVVFRLNLRLQNVLLQSNINYLRTLVHGGTAEFLGRKVTVLGLQNSVTKIQQVRGTLDKNDPRNAPLAEIGRFAGQTTLALGAAEGTLAATAHPVQLHEIVRPGRSYLLGSQLQSYALAVSLCFVGVLLAAGAIALERDENVIGRLSRGLASATALVVEKVILTAIVCTILGGLLAIAFGVAVSVQGAGGGQPWSRLPLLLPALAAAGAAIGSLGVLVGTLARELRTAAILALALVLPMIFLGIVPHELSPTAATVSDVFPFAPSAHVFSDVLFVSAPLGGLASGLAHLFLLTLVFGGAARVVSRRLS
jgi:ABC-type multidrug transport system permease subunit